MTASPNPAIVGQPVTFTATVTGFSPTGTVQFKDGAANLGAPVTLIEGVATLTTTALSAASNAISAVYSGDANNRASTSAVVAQFVNVPPQQIPALRTELLVLLALVLALSGAAFRRR